MKSNRERIIDVITQEFEELYTVFEDINKAHKLDTARGVSLDKLGELLGVDRLYNQTDTDYRSALSRIMQIRLGAGTKEIIIAYLENYLGITTDEFNVNELSPTNIQVIVVDTFSARYDEIKLVLNNITAAGIEVDVVFEAAYWDTDHWYDEGVYEDKWR